MKRRQLLTNLGLLTASSLIPLSKNVWIGQESKATSRQQKLIVIFLRGGADGLNIVVPYQDPEYYIARPSIALPPPQKSDGVIDLDGYFGLHPALAPLIPFWREKNLAFVHACGSPDSTRSHFQAQDYMENGTPGDIKTNTGWLNRLLSLLPGNHPVKGVNLGRTTPYILRGTAPVVNLPPGKQRKHSPINRGEISEALDQLYHGNDLLSLAYQDGRESQKILMEELNDLQNYQSKRGVTKDLLKLAQLIKGDAQSTIGFVNLGGWDTHTSQHHSLNRSLEILVEGLNTLVQELDTVYQNTLIVVVSEFGRTVRENGNRGTDHGHGNVIWLMGGNIPGGKVYGEWLGLAESNLYQQRDLAITTDFRQILWFMLAEHFQLSYSQMSQVFPNYHPDKKLFL